MNRISRYLHLKSIKSLQLDDWLMILAFTTYTVDIVFLNIVALLPTNLFPPGTDIATFGPADYALRIYGSKLTFLVELCQCTTVWTVKACLLTMYLRLTRGQTHRLYLQALAVYVGIGFVVMEILYLGVWCNPIVDYWSVFPNPSPFSYYFFVLTTRKRAVPTPNIQCSAATNHLITNAVLNLSSDVALLSIALPLFLRMTHLEPRKKAAICAVFGLGAFNIVAACLNKYYSFTNPFGAEWTDWYCHESSTSMVVANAPFLWALIRRCLGRKARERTRLGMKYGHGPAIMMAMTPGGGLRGMADEETGEQGGKDIVVAVVAGVRIEDDDGDKESIDIFA